MPNVNSSCAPDGQPVYESMTAIWLACMGQANTMAHDVSNKLLHNFQPPAIEPAIREELDTYIVKRKEVLA
jgi:trimethylamine:corrinoid methyltransferase-like protein